MEEVLNLFEAISPIFMWVILLGLVIFVGFISSVLSFHWKEYSVDAFKSNRMFRGYLFVSGVLLLVMIVALILMQS